MAGAYKDYRVTVDTGAVVQVTSVDNQFDSAPALKESLGFVARSIKVDNFTEAWLYFPDNNLYIPPWLIGATRPLYLNSTYAYFNWANPLGLLSAFTSNYEFVTITFYEDMLPYQPGSIAVVDLGVRETVQSYEQAGNTLLQTTFDINGTADPLPATMLSERRWISVYNNDTTENIWVGDITVTSSGATKGQVIRPQTGFVFPLSDTFSMLYGITDGSTVSVTTLEVGGWGNLAI